MFLFVQASEKMIILVVRVSVAVCGVMGACLAMWTEYVHLLWIISADIMYSMMVPQVVCIFYLQRWVNGYGACFGCVLALLLRVLVGEPMLGLPNLLPLPWDKVLEDGQRQHSFPFRTVIMLISTVVILLVSRFAACLSKRGLLRRMGDDEGDKDTRLMGPVGTDVEEKNRLNAEMSDLPPQQGNEEEKQLEDVLPEQL